MNTIKRWTFLAIGAVLISFGLSTFISIGVYWFNQVQTSTCISGKMLLRKDGNYVDLGEMEFCGKDLSVSGLYGPSLEHHIFLLRRQNAELMDALDQCNSRIQL